MSSFDGAAGGNGLVGSALASPPAAAAAPAPVLDLAQAQQALGPFVPTDGHPHSAAGDMLVGSDHPHDADAMGTADTAGHAHDDGRGMGGHGHDDAGGTGGHPHGDATGSSGHDHGEVDNAVVIADGDSWKGGPFEGWRIQWEPAGDDRAAAMRIINENEAPHAFSPTDQDCAGVTVTQSQVDYSTWLVARTHDALQRYRNRPDLALADGFVPYPLGNRYFHMIHPARMSTNSFVTGPDPTVGDPASEVLNPASLESFLYGMVDGAGLVPLGGMYMYGDKDAVPPAPFGCITSWHRHQGSQGFITSFDPTDPRSVWMFHVWDLEMIGPWGEHDGTHASDWWVGWRYLPNVCPGPDCL